MSAHQDATVVFIRANIDCKKHNEQLNTIIQNGLLSCASVDYVNMKNFITDMQKNIYLTPTMSLIDQVQNTPDQPNKDPCRTSLENLYRICPEIEDIVIEK